MIVVSCPAHTHAYTVCMLVLSQHMSPQNAAWIGLHYAEGCAEPSIRITACKTQMQQPSIKILELIAQHACVLMLQALQSGKVVTRRPLGKDVNPVPYAT